MRTFQIDNVNDRIQNLLKRLSSRDVQTREDARRSASNLNDDEIFELLDTARRADSEQMKRMGAWYAAVLLPMVLLPSWAAFSTSPGPIVRWSIFGLFLAAYVTTFPKIVGQTGYQQSLMLAVALANDRRLFGPLLAYYGFSASNRPFSKRVMTGEISFQVETALAAILSQDVSSEGNVLDMNGAERGSLLSSLKNGHPSVVTGLLRMLESLGDSRELPVVRALEQGKYASGIDTDVQNAAARCRTAIEARLSGEEVTATLLRPSQSQVQSSTLVRPASDMGRLETEALLRSSTEPVSKVSYKSETEEVLVAKAGTDPGSQS